MADQTNPKSVAERIEDAMRKIGTLLIAFAPLDSVLAEPARRGAFLLFFLLLGASFFAAALVMEKGRHHVD